MKIKTSELEGTALVWAVAVCEGATGLHHDTVATYWMTLDGKDIALEKGWAQSFLPSSIWSQGGPIIEREGIAIQPVRLDGDLKGWQAVIDLDEGDFMVQEEYGPTPLIAAMRAFVASKLGDELEIPEELST